MELRVVVGPSGSGKRTRLAILQDFFGFMTITGVQPKRLPTLVQRVCELQGDDLRLAVDVPAIPFNAEDVPSQYESYVEDCISAFRNLKQTYAGRDLMFIFQYCAQSDLAQRLTFGSHPLMQSTGDASGAIFKECTIQVQLFARLCKEHDAGTLAAHELVFADRTGKSAEQLKEEISQRRYLRNPQEPDTVTDAGASHEERARISDRVRRTIEKIEETLTRATKTAPQHRPDLANRHIFVTRGWNKMKTTVLALSKAEELIKSDAAVSLNFLLLGESGTGKEGLAAYLHHCRGAEHAAALVPIDCTAFPEDLLESELFGSRVGAFTGAVEREGLLKGAANGTVFLDEIGLMPIPLQAKLLRFIETRTFRSLGSNQVITVPNCRVIAATSRNLDEAVAEGRFLVDLYNRLRAVTITIPPLRERREDIFPLLAAFAPNVTFKPGAQALLFDYHWEGNIRELRTVAERYQVRPKEIHAGRGDQATERIEIGVSTLLEDWPQSVAKAYLESARKSRWATHEMNREGRKRIYFEVLREREGAGQLPNDIEALRIPSTHGASNNSATPKPDEADGQEPRSLATAVEPKDDEFLSFGAALIARMKTGTFGAEEKRAWDQAIDEVLRETGGNLSQTAARLRVDRSKVRARMNQHRPGGAAG